MTFQSLYRKYRPQRFDELLGQGHVTTALRHSVRDGRVGHAYLFSGPRGTGKTTTARILAKALNCADRGDDGEPCGVCDSCVEIAQGSSMDVIELDAASNNGVAEMRALLERVVFRSAGGRHRVYIVDEVHMLTKGASNALLKTLEEPPEHVVFVLATTDPQSVLPTIRSRTQHFEFHLLPTENLAAYLGQIAEHEKVEVDTETLSLVARRGAGSVRDALSLLDQALALGEGSVGADDVRGLFEATAFGRLADLIERVAQEDVGGVIASLADALAAGAEPRQVTDDLLRYLRDVFLVSASGGEARLEVLAEEREQLRAHGEALGGSRVMRAIETLGDAAVEMRRAPDPRLVLEVALVRITRREAGSTTEILLDRVERLEKAIAELRDRGGGTPSPAPIPAAPPASEANPAVGPEEEPRPALGAVRARQQEAVNTDDEGEAPESPPPPAPPAATTPDDHLPLDLDDVVLAWPDALGRLSGRLKAMAREAQPVEIDGATVVLGLPETYRQVHKPIIEGGLDDIAAALEECLERPVRVRLVLHEGFLSAGTAGADDPDTDPAPGATPDPAGGGGQTGTEPEGDEDRAEGGADDGAVDSVAKFQDAFDATIETDDSEGERP